MNIGVHILDLSLWLMGNPEPVVKFQEVFYGSKIIDAIYESAKEDKMIKI